MDNQEYLILRRGHPDLSDPFSGAFTFTGRSAEIPSMPAVESATMSQKEVADARRDPDVSAIAPALPIKLVTPTSIPQETVDAFATDHAAVSANATWGVSATGAAHSRYDGNGVAVAVLDTGIDRTHPAFAGVNLDERDFTGTDNGDTNGHGTHVAGTIFGRSINRTRIGVAPGVQRALIGKVLDNNGNGSTTQLAEAILWAVDGGADVVSMSLGFDFPGYVTRLTQQGFPVDVATNTALQGYRANLRLFDQLIEYVEAKGAFGRCALIVAAAGNESNKSSAPPVNIAVAPPAAADGAVSVGALTPPMTDGNMSIASFSNTGANIVAPGVDVLSAWPDGGVRNLNGTSMATPHVTGVAALWAEFLRTNFGRIEIRQLAARVMGSATRMGIDPNVNPGDIGAGLVRAPI